MYEKYGGLVYKKPWRRTKKKNQWTIHVISKRKKQKPFRIDWIQSFQSLDTVKSSYRQHVNTCCAHFRFQWGTRHREECFRNKTYLQHGSSEKHLVKCECNRSIQVMVKNRWPWMYEYNVRIDGVEKCLRTPNKFRAHMSTKRTSASGMENEDSSKRRVGLFCTRTRVWNTRTSLDVNIALIESPVMLSRCRVIAIQILRVASTSCKSKAKRSRVTHGMISVLGSPTFHECVRVLMGEGVQGFAFWAEYTCDNGDWVPKRCWDKTGVTSKWVRHPFCALALLSEKLGSVATCPRRTSSLVSCIASQSRLARTSVSCQLPKPATLACQTALCNFKVSFQQM